MKIEHPIIAKVLELYSKLRQNKTIKFMWIPSHIGIKGNTMADDLAKEAVDKKVV